MTFRRARPGPGPHFTSLSWGSGDVVAVVAVVVLATLAMIGVDRGRS